VRQLICLNMAAILLVAGAGASFGQRPCLRIEAEPVGATIILRHEVGVSNSAPASFCALEPGREYKLTVLRPDFEVRTLKFSFPEYGKPAQFSGIRMGMLVQSMVLPGWGQKSLGEGARTLETIAVLTAGGFKIAQAYTDYDAAREARDAVARAARDADTEEELSALAAEAEKTGMVANVHRDNTLWTVALTGYEYLQNLVETFLLAAPPKAERLEGSNFKVTTPGKSRSRAAVQSLFFPGMGQRYLGNSSRGFLFRAGFFVVALYTIDAKYKYNMAKVDYDLAYQEFQNATSVEEREAARVVANAQHEVMSDREQVVYEFAAAAGAFWLAGVVDAIATGGRSDGSGRVDFDSSYRAGMVRAGIRVTF
jgi:hypothetical protein